MCKHVLKHTEHRHIIYNSAWHVVRCSVRFAGISLSYPSSMPMFCLPLPRLSDCPQTPRLTPYLPSPHASPWIDTRTASTPSSPACLLPTPSLSSEKHLTTCSVQIPCGSHSTIFPPALILSRDVGGRGGRIGYKKRIE